MLRCWHFLNCRRVTKINNRVKFSKARKYLPSVILEKVQTWWPSLLFFFSSCRMLHSQQSANQPLTKKSKVIIHFPSLLKVYVICIIKVRLGLSKKSKNPFTLLPQIALIETFLRENEDILSRRLLITRLSHASIMAAMGKGFDCCGNRSLVEFSMEWRLN